MTRAEREAREIRRRAIEAHEFFMHPERWPYVFAGGRRAARIQRVGKNAEIERRDVYSDDRYLSTLAERGWEPD